MKTLCSLRSRPILNIIILQMSITMIMYKIIEVSLIRNETWEYILSFVFVLSFYGEYLLSYKRLYSIIFFCVTQYTRNRLFNRFFGYLWIATRVSRNWPFFTSRETGKFLSISRDPGNFPGNNWLIINCNTYLIRGPHSRRGCGLLNLFNPMFYYANDYWSIFIY